jgi:hypothetical protein
MEYAMQEGALRDTGMTVCSGPIFAASLTVVVRVSAIGHLIPQSPWFGYGSEADGERTSAPRPACRGSCERDMGSVPITVRCAYTDPHRRWPVYRVA